MCRNLRNEVARSRARYLGLYQSLPKCPREGLAVRPCWGPMFGGEAVSEQGLALPLPHKMMLDICQGLAAPCISVFGEFASALLKARRMQMERVSVWGKSRGSSGGKGLRQATR